MGCGSSSTEQEPDEVILSPERVESGELTQIDRLKEPEDEVVSQIAVQTELSFY